jgi:hypothetical protein
VIAVIQEKNKSTPQAFLSNGNNIYTSSLSNKHEFGTAFLVDSKHNQLVMKFAPINERLCIMRVKADSSTTLLINIHAPTNDSDDEAKNSIYEELEWTYSACP